MLQTNTRKLSKSRPWEPADVVVQSQLSLSVEPTFPSDKYPVITCPSAYCATSSGMDIDICRASTQPALPSCVRTRYQSSSGTDLTGAGSPPSSVARGRDSSTQLAGGAGAGGGGGGGSLPCLACFGGAFFTFFAFFALTFAGATGGITAFRGDTR